jgi:hypothetical protein
VPPSWLTSPPTSRWPKRSNLRRLQFQRKNEAPNVHLQLVQCISIILAKKGRSCLKFVQLSLIWTA